jgi:hypothetical protein
LNVKRFTRIVSVRPFIGTLVGTAISLIAIVVWLVTFEPHGGPELSHYLFPGSAILLERMFPSRSIPVPLWYSGALLHWVFPGLLVDLLRTVFRRGLRHDNAAKHAASKGSGPGS